MAGRSLNFTSEGSTHSRNSSFLIGMDSLLRWVKKIFMNTNALPVFPFTPPLSFFSPSSVHSIYTNLLNISLDSKAADDVMKLSPPSLVGAASSWGIPNQVALHNDKSIRLPSFTSLHGRSYSQLVTLVKACAGVVTGTSFRQTIYLILKENQKLNVTFTKNASGTQNITKAFINIFSIFKINIKSVTIDR